MLRLMCKRHPKFTGKKQPRASCEQCIELAYIAQVRAPMYRVEVK